jgi:methyl coenzyme M reductase subunit C-like uncharacterized protein (methanogenesis marker protein 7)
MFIECYSLKGTPRYIMIDKIVSWSTIYLGDVEYTLIRMTEGEDIRVKDTPEEVANKIKNAKRAGSG